MSIKPKYKDVDGLDPVYCGHCGRFLGYEKVLFGHVKILCPKCKGWTEIKNNSDDTVDAT